METAQFLRPAWRKRRTLAAERCITGVAVVEQRFVVGEAAAAAQLKVGVLGIGSIHQKVDPLGNAVIAAKETNDLVCCEGRN
jgi:hypothetical protein